MEGILYFRDFFYINVVNLIFLKVKKIQFFRVNGQKNFLVLKGLRQTFDNIVSFYNLTLLIIQSDERSWFKLSFFENELFVWM